MKNHFSDKVLWWVQKVAKEPLTLIYPEMPRPFLLVLPTAVYPALPAKEVGMAEVEAVGAQAQLETIA